MYRKIFTSCAILLASVAAHAQDLTYHLPKTAVSVTLLVEKTTYTPGDLAIYSQRFLKKTASLTATEKYRIVKTEMALTAVPDTSHIYSARMENKLNIQKFELSDDNILLAINTEGRRLEPAAQFASAVKPAALDPYKYLDQDILSVGSKLKMAEMCADEIYEIRDSRNELTRGQADYMPKDGEQLSIMLSNLETQESAIRQLFEGTTVCDTVQVVMTYIPEKGRERDVLFRFSEHYGVVDADDLSGDPYYMTVEDLKSMPERIVEPGKKAPKDETGIWIALPGKVRVSLENMEAKMSTLEFSAAQFGEVENLNAPLFSKKVETRLVLNPYNGGIESIESQPIK
jgi:hypothetical protein